MLYSRPRIAENILNAGQMKSDHITPIALYSQLTLGLDQKEDHQYKGRQSDDSARGYRVGYQTSDEAGWTVLQSENTVERAGGGRTDLWVGRNEASTVRSCQTRAMAIKISAAPLTHLATL